MKILQLAIQYTVFVIGFFTPILILIFLMSRISFGASIESTIVKEAKRQGLAPRVALAVAKVESRLNPKAVGKKGEIGLFQVRPEFSPVAAHLLYSPEVNARIGIQHLLYFKKNCPATKGLQWVGCYNQGLRRPKHPELLPYYKKVMREIGAK